MRFLLGMLVSMLAVPVARSAGPDVIVSDIYEHTTHGCSGDWCAYSFGSESCNIGDEILPWFQFSDRHPVIAWQMYRIEDGRFEQLGQSWVKHGIGALAQSNCGSCEDPEDLDYLGVNCSDPYTAPLNGFQVFLGVRSDVNAYTGIFNWPKTAPGFAFGTVNRRLQVRSDDIDPAQHSDAEFLIECVYVTPDDSYADGNGANNFSYREIQFDGEDRPYDLSFVGETVEMQSAMYGWAARDPSVRLTEVEAPENGRLILGSRVQEVEGGWRYDYALQNLDCDLGVRGFGMFTDSSRITDLTYNDVKVHSGENIETEDWSILERANGIGWFTKSYEDDPRANVIRWGSVFSFGFVAETPPVDGDAIAVFHKPGAEPFLRISTQIPE